MYVLSMKVQKELAFFKNITRREEEGKRKKAALQYRRAAFLNI